MMEAAGREREQDQRSLVAAYDDAATAHDQAAQMHEKIAEHYDRHAKSARAMHERRMAAQERRSAVADRRWVATLTGGVTRSSSDESDRPGSWGADLAALIGATIAVVFTVTNTPGAWGPVSTIIGLLLLLVLLAFFWRRRPQVEKRRIQARQGRNWRSFFSGKKLEFIFVGLALSLVVGYVAAIASAQAIQLIRFSDDRSFECRSLAVEQAITSVRDLSDAFPHTKVLRQLTDDTLQNGGPSGQFVVHGSTEVRALKIAFYDAYEETRDDCLAGETFNALWWVGIPAFLLTLAWWNWDYIINSAALNKLKGDRVRGIGIITVKRRQRPESAAAKCSNHNEPS